MTHFLIFHSHVGSSRKEKQPLASCSSRVNSSWVVSCWIFDKVSHACHWQEQGIEKRKEKKKREKREPLFFLSHRNKGRPCLHKAKSKSNSGVCDDHYFSFGQPRGLVASASCTRPVASATKTRQFEGRFHVGGRGHCEDRPRFSVFCLYTLVA